MELIKAPIDNKNLLEDAFEDDVFQNFYAAPDHRVSNSRHLVGFLRIPNEDGIVCEEGYVDVKWFFGDNSVNIQVIATPAREDYEYVRDAAFDYYERLFKSWENEQNEGLRVKFNRVLSILTVSFWYECE